ncbi:hypothetical protein [Flavobacterium sp. GSB-24]|uniref:hypothetical protein n=1 Tax=Flavobacterium sp. GSB-24 TaxID=2994319 RepID=UPI002491C4EA|nr:hypothetical protein [Flavobacterium sp. GSB-24]BDU25131.1 hypothetical protein FLGSB24_18750 [Flavobacterium sp. GSB-24]
MNRIVFFSKDDLTSIPMMEKINEFLKNYQSPLRSVSINDILELHHIVEYIDNGFVYASWKENETDNYKKQIKEFKREINIFFNGLTSSEIAAFYNEIDYNYLESFWLLVNRFKVYENITSEDLEIIFGKERFNIDDILYCSRVVQFFEEKIRVYLFTNFETAENLLDYYEASHDGEQKEKFFPKSLTLSDKEELINKYLDTENVNLNYIRLIERNKDSEFLKISDKTRLKAKRLSKKINDEVFTHENTTSIRRGASLSEDQEEMATVYYKEGVKVLSYSVKRLKEKTDKITLFKNYRRVFSLLDFQGCIDLVSKSSRIDTIERILMKSKNEFFISLDFQDKSLEGALKFEIYKHFLHTIDLRVEDLLQYYVNDYLNHKFNISTFKLYLPSSSGTYLEKIRLLVPEFESLIEQYRLYVHDGLIDYELLQVSTKTSGFEKIPSLVKKKYVYPAGEEYQKLSHNFFSEISILFDYQKYGKKYRSFFHLISSEDIKIDDFKDFKKEFVQKFVDENYLKIDHHGYLKPFNRMQLTTIGILRNNDVISYWCYPEIMRNEIDSMEKKKMVSFSGSLFSKAEKDYYNFYLNNRFSNGLWLRNKYVHATNSHDEQEQMNDYQILLKLLVLLVLKIEDDLVINSRINAEKVL